jgi:uncharacterized C2H2 Zn-finger protein
MATTTDSFPRRDSAVMAEVDELCDKVTQTMLASKANTSQSAKPVFRCPRCKATFKIMSRLRKHIILVHCKPFICPGCPRMSGSPRDLIRHMRGCCASQIPSGRQPEPMDCPRCGLTFSRKDNWVRHVGAAFGPTDNTRVPACMRKH